jgi:hypothetical protein
LEDALLNSGLLLLASEKYKFSLGFCEVYKLYLATVALKQPPLWSSGQSSWLQIRRPGFDSWHYQKKKVVGLERGALGLVSTTEELLDRKVAAPVRKPRIYGRRDPSR